MKSNSFVYLSDFTLGPDRRCSEDMLSTGPGNLNISGTYVAMDNNTCMISSS